MPTCHPFSSRVKVCAYALFAALFIALLQPITKLSLAQSDTVLFGDTLDPLFQSWSFHTTVDFAAPSPAYGGSSRAIAVTYQSGNWGHCGWCDPAVI